MKKLLFVTMVAASIILVNACKKKDKCENTVCLNGGICNDGTCSCPTGYTGADCGTQVTPAKIRLDSIHMTKFPALKSNNDNWDWDPISASTRKPDIYIKLNDSVGVNLINNVNDKITNADAQTYKLPIIPYDFTDYGMKYKIEMLDYDAVGSDEKMDELIFKVYESTNKFPSKIVVTSTSGKMELELFVSYSY